MNYSPAAEAVGATGELLELVLLSMDMQTLLGTASRVCRQWRHVINTLPAIQDRLFFDPGPVESTYDGIPHKTLNPLLLNPDPSCFEKPKDFTPPPKPGIFDVNFWPVLGRMGFMELHEMALDHANLEAADFPMVRPDASWRNMYTSQPPSRTAAVISHRGDGQAPGRVCPGSPISPLSGVFEFETGMRMGDLYNIAVQHCKKHPIDGFLIVSLGGGAVKR